MRLTSYRCFGIESSGLFWTYSAKRRENLRGFYAKSSEIDDFLSPEASRQGVCESL